MVSLAYRNCHTQRNSIAVTVTIANSFSECYSKPFYVSNCEPNPDFNVIDIADENLQWYWDVIADKHHDAVSFADRIIQSNSNCYSNNISIIIVNTNIIAKRVCNLFFISNAYGIPYGNFEPKRYAERKYDMFAFPKFFSDALTYNLADAVGVSKRIWIGI